MTFFNLIPSTLGRFDYGKRPSGRGHGDQVEVREHLLGGKCPGCRGQSSSLVHPGRIWIPDSAQPQPQCEGGSLRMRVRRGGVFSAISFEVKKNKNFLRLLYCGRKKRNFF